MATGILLLSMVGALPADGTGTINNPPDFRVLTSTGTQPTNGPKVSEVEALFDAAVDEHVMWAFRMPVDYASGGTIKIPFQNVSVQSGTLHAFWKFCLAAIIPAEVVTTKVFPALDTLDVALASNQAAGTLTEGSAALSGTALNGVAAGDWVILTLGRDADNAGDTATGDMAVGGIAFEYVTT
jgi:hypothetical protein